MQERTASKISELEKENADLIKCLWEVKQNHQKEMTLAWERVTHLQNNLEGVVLLLAEDKYESKVRKESERFKFHSPKQGRISSWERSFS